MRCVPPNNMPGVIHGSRFYPDMIIWHILANYPFSLLLHFADRLICNRSLCGRCPGHRARASLRSPRVPYFWRWRGDWGDGRKVGKGGVGLITTCFHPWWRPSCLITPGSFLRHAIMCYSAISALVISSRSVKSSLRTIFTTTILAKRKRGVN